MKFKISKKLLATVLAIAMVVTGFGINNTSKTTKAASLGSSGDYEVTAEEISSSVCKINFNSKNYAAYAILHYKVNDGAQQNVTMSGSDKQFQYSINGLKKGDKLTCVFTYNKGNAQYDTSEMTYVTGSTSSTDANIQAPFGLVVNSPKDNTVSVVWGRGNIDSYNVYIDNDKVANKVTCGYYEYGNISAGTHTVSVTTVSGSRESAKTSLSVTVKGQTQQVTTAAPTTTTAEKGVVYIYQDINYGGRVAALNEGRYNLAALQAKGFKNDDLSSLKVASGYEAILYYDDNFQGESRRITSDTAWIGSDFNDRTSSIIVQKKTVETTTTVKATEKENTDTGIAKPFGLVVSNPSAGTIGVVWGRGNINSYNVYIDGNKVASKVGCAYYTYSGYSQGTHTVAITTVSGNKESAKETMTVNVAQSGSGQAPATTKAPTTTKPATTTPSTSIGTDVPQLDSSIPVRSDKMFLQLNNKTNGKYKDSEIYWIVLGRNKNHEICYLDAQGNLVKASESLNTVTKNGRKCANVAHSMAEAKYVYLPDIESGRMYLSYGEPVYVTFINGADGKVGYAGPDLNNPSDPNSDVLFEFAEFTVTNKEYWGNTTRVDFFSFPVVTRLVGQGGFDNRPGDYPTYDKTVGDIGTRDQIFNAWKNSAPAAWKSLYDGKRIMAPCKTTFNEGKENGHYFDNYINEFWNKYSNETLVFRCDAGTFRGRVSGDHMTFTKDGDGGTYTIYKPTTQDVLEGKGNFNRGNSTELVIEAQLCAAFNRGVATDPANYQNPSAYYKNGTYNYYSKFLHERSVNNFSYGFCYDDVNDQSTLLHYTNPTALILDLKW
ncbi:MAG: beta-1,3-glucanase family protein [Eubacterium sp.]|uniref:beta-1,3-glucanase family protein n=1 Tax=Eubacterium sp. TaxID=142586 RepID=UPI00399C3128